MQFIVFLIETTNVAYHFKINNSKLVVGIDLKKRNEQQCSSVRKFQVIINYAKVWILSHML